jgi:hypothetical protein
LKCDFVFQFQILISNLIHPCRHEDSKNNVIITELTFQKKRCLVVLWEMEGRGKNNINSKRVLQCKGIAAQN